jgi:hypothetical protein
MAKAVQRYSFEGVECYSELLISLGTIRDRTELSAEFRL